MYSNTEYVNAKTPLRINCRTHGFFYQIPSVHLSGCGCPSCSSSKLESDISLLLDENGFYYERQKGFEWLHDKRPLKLDFYIPKYNVAIECQGLQHFKPIEYFGGEESLESAIVRDELKQSLCNQHGIRILYYSQLGIDYPYPVFEDKDELLQAINSCLDN